MTEIGINSSVLAEILAGRKTIETRLAIERFLSFRVGDTISLREDVWQDGKIVESFQNKAQIVITKIEKFDSFRKMLQQVGYENVMPSAENIDAALKAYELYYSSEDEKKYGVIAFHMELVE